MPHFTDPTSGQVVKGAVHGALLTLLAMCVVYNTCAWGKRRQRHSAWNVVLYVGMAAYEVYQVWHHTQQITGAPHQIAGDPVLSEVAPCY